ncbi:MAG TPA: DUF6065 family protein [Geminicoccaceae bacterium]|nr:DUF6065 family protein [Geminicoccaceae bacterium]
MKLVCYTLHHEPPTIRPAPLERAWMDASPQQFAYRCLPLNIANAHGWEVLCPTAFTAVWDGGAGRDAIRISSEGPEHRRPLSHFGAATLTFHLSCLFRTEPGVDLFVTGPLNAPKRAIAPLSGIIETDWAPYSFTMNWLFTEPDHPVHFAEGEPFCCFFPLARGLLEASEPEFRPLAQDPELEAAFRDWSRSRAEFNRDLKTPESEARLAKWQKTYFRGLMPDGSRRTEEHRTRLRLRPFREPE